MGADSKAAIAVIGGTGFYELPGLENFKAQEVETPFGETSSPIGSGELYGERLLFIARHGPNHSILPSEINYRANIWALKSLGAKWCISVSAVGSLREEIAPGHFVAPRQFIDRTRLRKNTFFGNGLVAHVNFAEPTCPVLRAAVSEIATEVAKRRSQKFHDGQTYLCMEGPAFSTRAESRLYRDWGADIIGMTALPEAKLAREAEIAYTTLALVTDYDCWRSDTADIDIELLLATLRSNSDAAKEIVSNVVSKLSELEPSTLASNALATALITPLDKVPGATINALKPVLGRYL